MTAHAKKNKQLVISATTAWIHKDYDALNKLLKEEVYANTEATYSFVTMLLETIRFLEQYIADASNSDIAEVHRRLAILVELDKV